jgi:hypothetical protein
MTLLILLTVVLPVAAVGQRPNLLSHQPHPPLQDASPDTRLGFADMVWLPVPQAGS